MPMGTMRPSFGEIGEDKFVRPEDGTTTFLVDLPLNLADFLLFKVWSLDFSGLSLSSSALRFSLILNAVFPISFKILC